MRTLIFFLSITLVGWSQKPVEFETIKDSDKITFVCKNNTSTQVEVTLTLKDPKGIKGYENPVTKLVSSEGQLVFLTVSHSGKYSFSLGYSYLEKPTPEEQLAFQELKSTYYTSDFSNLNQGIYVFDKPGCPRCKRSTAYLIDNDYDFRIIDARAGSPGNQLMFELLRERNINGSVIMPVIMIDGQITKSHRDLMKFVKSIDKNKT